MHEQPTMIIDPLGTKRWHLHDQLHREDGPAVEYATGTKMWYRHDQIHRENGPAVEHANGNTEWWGNDHLHREDGPAVKNATNGSEQWHLHGQLHREDGPAVVSPGSRYQQWYWHGVQVPQHVVEDPESISVQEIEAQINAEVRRVMIERFGLERYVAEARFETVAQDDCGTLLKKRQVGDEDLVVVKVICPSTGHIHFLRVPPTTNTPLEGIAWTFDMSPRDYLLSAEA